jgi:alkylated DNA repair protein (DNA oxidative demethylase)
MQTVQSRGPYEALVRAIAYQQLTAKAGDAIIGRLKALFEGRQFPHPEDLVGADFDAMRTCGFYDRHHPETGGPWPAMPECFLELAVLSASRAGYPDFCPDACLINRYEPGARLSLHQDKNERDFVNPIVSVSLGPAAAFQFGGLKRNDPVRKFALRHGDVAVWGGPSRLCYHGVSELKEGVHEIVGRMRINLTFRGAL